MHKLDMTHPSVRKFIRENDLLTTLFYYPEYFHHVICHQEKGLMRFVKGCYGAFWKTCKPLIEPLTSILKSNAAPCERRKAFIFAVLTLLEDVKPIQKAFRKTVKEKDLPLFDNFLIFLRAEHQKLRTVSFDISNTVNLVNSFVDTVMIRAWIMRCMTFITDYSTPPVEVSLKKEVSIKELMDVCKTNKTVQEQLAGM